MKIFIVIPAYNEERNIKRVVEEAREYGEVVVVDDASRDGTVEEIKKLEKEGSRRLKKAQEGEKARIVVLRHIINRGQGAALQTGIDYALRQGAEVVVTMDSDGQHQAKEIGRLVEPVKRGEVDVALGSRFLDKTKVHPAPEFASLIRCGAGEEKVPWLKKWLVLKPAILFNNLICGIKLTDAHNGFRAMSRKAAEKIIITQDKMAHATEIVSEIKRYKLKYKEVGVTVLYNEFGQGMEGGLRVIKDLVKRKMFS